MPSLITKNSFTCYSYSALTSTSQPSSVRMLVKKQKAIIYSYWLASFAQYTPHLFSHAKDRTGSHFIEPNLMNKKMTLRIEGYPAH